MTAFQARIRGDSFWDDIEAETAEAAAEKFAQFLYREEHMFRDEHEDATVVEIVDALQAVKVFTILPVVSVQFDIAPAT